MLAEELENERQGRSGGLVDRLGQLEEVVDTTKVNSDTEFKNVYRSISGLWHSISVLNRRTSDYNDHFESLDDGAERMKRQLIEIDDASMRVEERVDALETSMTPILAVADEAKGFGRGSAYEKQRLEKAKSPPSKESSITMEFGSNSLDRTLSDCESTNSGSIGISVYSGIQLLEEGHPFRSIKAFVVDKGLLVFEKSKQCQQAGPNNTESKGTPSSINRGKSDAAPPKKRRLERGGGSEEARNSDDDEELPAKRSRTSKRVFGTHASLACPFAKKDPLRYRGCLCICFEAGSRREAASVPLPSTPDLLSSLHVHLRG